MTGPAHEPARIWGSPKGRTVTCECGLILGPSWESVTDLMAAHLRAVKEKAA